MNRYKFFSSAKYNGISNAQLEAHVKKHYQSHIQGTTVINADKGITIYFNRTGKKKSTASLTRQKSIALLHVRELLEVARFKNFGLPKQKHISKHKALGFLNFHVKFFLDGKLVSYRIPVMITPNGKFQYDFHEAQKK